MKILLTILFFAFSFAKPNEKFVATTYVYICDSKTAYAYHATKRCDGLNNCQHEIICVTLDDAVHYYKRKPCKLCEKEQDSENDLYKCLYNLKTIPMCYINGVKVSLKEYIAYKEKQKELKHLNKLLLLQPAKRGFDYSDWPIIKPSADGKDWDPVAMEWGFIPSWINTRDAVEKFRNGYKDATGKYIPGYTTLNAMGEEILNKKMFREAALKRRCLILSSGFYEHRHVQVMGKKGKLLKTPEKFPYHITVKDAESFMMAGIYNTFIDKVTGEVKDTFAILTTSANSLMAQVHNSKMRMPTILTDALANEWTEPGLSENRIIELATHQYPPEKMHAYSVRKDFLQHADPETAFIYESR